MSIAIKKTRILDLRMQFVIRATNFCNIILKLDSLKGSSNFENFLHFINFVPVQ